MKNPATRFCLDNGTPFLGYATNIVNQIFVDASAVSWVNFKYLSVWKIRGVAVAKAKMARLSQAQPSKKNKMSRVNFFALLK